MIRYVSPAGVAFIQRQERCSLVAYLDEAGIRTIGWGHAYWRGDSPITQAQADALLMGDLLPCEAVVSRLVRAPFELSQDAFDACCSLAFNIGTGGFAESTVLKRINAGDMHGAALAFLMWDKVTDPASGHLVVSAGLAARRKEEASLFYGSDPTLGGTGA